MVEFYLPNNIRMVEGVRSSITMEVINHSSQTQGLIEVKTSYGILFRIGALPGGASEHIFPEIIFPIRGVYQISGLTAESIFPFGLIRVRRKLNQSGSITVVPAVYDCLPPIAAGFEPMTGGLFTGKYKSSSGSEFAGVREYNSDDPIRSIHWKSSAKGRGLMVKEFNEELSGRITVIIDCTTTPPINGETLLDRAVRAAGSITLAALDIGHHVDIISMSQMEVMKYPPFADGTQLLDMLAGVKEKEESMTVETLRKAVELASVRSALCFIALKPSQALDNILEELANDGRKISLYLPAEDINSFNPPDGVKVSVYEKRV